MKRREFIGLACGASVLTATTSRAAWAVEPHKVYRIAMLHPSHPVSDLTENSGLNYYREYYLELRRLGYIEGKNLVVERFSGEGRVDHYPELAREAAARNPNVIFAVTNEMAAVLKEVTSTIPIVAFIADPVQSSLATSMARPGGNITGVSVDTGPELSGKRLQLLREVVPTISKLGILGPQNYPETAVMQEATEKAGIGVAGPFYMNKGTDDQYRQVSPRSPSQGPTPSSWVEMPNMSQRDSSLRNWRRSIGCRPSIHIGCLLRPVGSCPMQLI
jgi:putative ABC transport system substrate-binding protein